MVDHSFQRVDLSCHIFSEIFDIGAVDHFKAFLQLVFVITHRRQLQITFDLLSNFLITIDDRHAGYRINPIQRLQTHVDQLVFPCYFTEMDDRLSK